MMPSLKGIVLPIRLREMETTVRILNRVHDTERGMEPSSKLSSLAYTECLVKCVPNSKRIIYWKEVPFLWGYQVISPDQPLSHRYKAFDVFREDYIGTRRNPLTHSFKIPITIHAENILFMKMTHHPFHPFQDEDTFKHNCFDTDHFATLYTFTCSHYEVFTFLHNNHSNLFEVETEPVKK